MKQQLPNDNNYFCGFVTIVGKSNVGKSTLLNSLIGQKISITADRPQTTRRKILGIKTIDNKQAVYIDTPGIAVNHKSALNKLMNLRARISCKDVDLILFVTDSLSWDHADQKVLKFITQRQYIPPVFWVINKIDLAKNNNLLLTRVKELQEQYKFTEIFPISASKNINLNLLERAIFNMLPSSNHYFAATDVTDQNLSFRIAEIVREKLIKNLSQELPYVTHVEINKIEQSPRLYNIDATIWVEKIGQKKIVIGDNGSKIKIIGTQARLDLEKFLKTKVFLTLFVQVKSDWTNNTMQLKNHV